MLNRLTTVFVIISTCFLQLACSTTSEKDAIPPEKVTYWDAPLSGKAGTLHITFNLPQQAWAEFALFDSAKRSKRDTPVRIALSNQNCVRGHQVAVNHNPETGTFLTKYFSQEALWNKSNTLRVSWTADRNITVVLNTETINIEHTDALRFLRITSFAAPIAIEKFEYSPQE